MKYLDKDGLQQYDALIKEFVNNHVPDLAQVANLAVALEDAADPTATVKFALCTQAEYDALESYQENVIYIITDDTSGVVYTYANPVLDGTETVLTGITIQGIKYTIPQGTEVTANPTLDGNETPLTGLQIGNTKYKAKDGITRFGSAAPSIKDYFPKFLSTTWETITMTAPGTATFQGISVFRFKNHTYYYNNAESYIYEFNRNTKTWSVKNWTEFTPSEISNGSGFFTDGKSLFFKRGYTNGSYLYYFKYDEATDSWTSITISGIVMSGFDTRKLWTDGKKLYYSASSTQKYLSESNGTYTWSDTTWTGLTQPDGVYIWTDNVEIYHTQNNISYRLNKASSNTWEPVTFSSTPNQWFYDGIWSDGENTYYDFSSKHYVLDKKNLAWVSYDKSGLSGDNWRGTNVWTDGVDFYATYSGVTKQRVRTNIRSIGRTCLSPYATESYVDDAIAGAGKLYAHYIYIKGDDTTPDDDITCSILTNSATPMTFYDICKWLYEHGFNSGYTYFPANSVSAAWTEYGYISIGIKCISNPDTAQNYQIDTTALMIDLRSSSTDRFKRSTVTAISSLQYKTVYDTVIKIL